VIRQNIDKAWLLTETARLVDDLSQLLPDSVEILKSQLIKMEEEQMLSVLCTCAFYIAEYNPSFL